MVGVLEVCVGAAAGLVEPVLEEGLPPLEFIPDFVDEVEEEYGPCHRELAPPEGVEEERVERADASEGEGRA